MSIERDFHDRFEWDDTIAAHEYRQCRRTIRWSYLFSGLGLLASCAALILRLTAP